MILFVYASIIRRAMLRLLLLSAPLLMAASAQADTLATIQSRGVVVVGVKKDVMLWGYQNPKTNLITGLEVDLAKNLAERLGVRLKLLGLRSIERLDATQSGRVDVLIATLSDTPERQAVLTMVRPHYYSSGVNLLARKQEGFRKWTELKNRKVCGRHGSYYNRPVAVEYGADIIAFHSLDWATRTVRDGRCSALLYDDTAIVTLLQDAAWSNNYEMPMPTLYATPWSIAIAKEEQGSRLEKILSSAVIHWHRSGLIAQLERKWKIPATDFVRQMHQNWSRKATGGQWYCGEEISTTTPQPCLSGKI